jgi:hypothetical protein
MAGRRVVGLTEKEYLESGGLRCPVCGERDGVTALSNLDRCGEFIYQNVQCTICGSEWQDRHRLEGYYFVEEDYIVPEED